MGSFKSKIIEDSLKLSETHKQLIESTKAMDALRSTASGHLAGIQAMVDNSSFRRMMEQINRDQEMIKRALGPLHEMKSLGILGQISVDTSYTQAFKTMTDFESRFKMPAIAEASRIFESFKSPALLGMQAELGKLQEAMKAMTHPWADSLNMAASISSFAELQRIGESLKGTKLFAADLTKSLRVSLGDWRDPITSWPKPLVLDINARVDFYASQGLNQGLTDFPSPAFEEGLEVTGIRQSPPHVIREYSYPSSSEAIPEDEEGFQRTNKAHDWIQRFETQVREFIDRIMTYHFTQEWPQNRLPNGLYEKWLEKKKTLEQEGGKSFPLISYADFTDYERVVCKRDNWPVFRPYFIRPESFRESMQRLHLPRLTVMHSRIIMQADELLLYAEITRLVRVFKRTIASS